MIRTVFSGPITYSLYLNPTTISRSTSFSFKESNKWAFCVILGLLYVSRCNAKKVHITKCKISPAPALHMQMCFYIIIYLNGFLMPLALQKLIRMLAVIANRIFECSYAKKLFVCSCLE